MGYPPAVLAHPICRRWFPLAGALLVLAPLLAVGQSARRQAPPAAPDTRPFSAAAAQARRDQLAKIPELLADPDPNARLANLESIMATNDATMIPLALRLAFQSDDANLRALAMRAYIANLKEVTFDMLLPAQVVRLYEAAQNDPHRTDELFQTYSYLRYLAGAGFKVHLVFTRYNSAEPTGEVRLNGANAAPFTISGDRLSAKADMPNVKSCYLDFRPSNDMTLRGTMVCEPEGNTRFPKLGISAPLF
jgi:hypothetical protein